MSKPGSFIRRLLMAFLLHLLLSPAYGLELRAKARTINGPIKTIVVLVMENRSFDHMIGWMKRLIPDIDGVTGKEFNRLSTTDPDSPIFYFEDKAEFVDPDPGHSFQAIREQIFGSNETTLNPPPMNGFAQQAESMSTNLPSTVMNGFRPEVIPVYTALALDFAVCDRWFAAVPASTQPNRLFVHSATSHGATGNVDLALLAGYPQKTIFDSVFEAGLSFGVYYQNLPSVLFFKNLRQPKYVQNFRKYELSFKKDALAGSLSNYVVVEQRYFDLVAAPANDDHPSHDVSEGQKLVKEVYEILRASPQWNETLFVVTYDEHGGFFDHVPTPVMNVPSPDGIIGPAPFYFKFDRLGVRVPTLLISPWINKGTVLHEPEGPTSYSQYEHSSIPATVKKLFNLDSGFLTHRDAWAGSFESLLYERNAPRTDCPETLPSPPWTLRHSPPNEARTLSDFQEELVRLAAQLVADHNLNSYTETGKVMTIKQANDFVENAMTRFLEAGKDALRVGSNSSTTVKLNPSLTGRKAKFCKLNSMQCD
eukprot:c15395_g1_i1 orf=534-2141(-)